MEKKKVAVPRELYEMGLLRAAALCALLAALAGSVGVVLLFSGDYREFLTGKLLTGGITAAGALFTWRIINSAITVLCFLCPAVISAGLIRVLRRETAAGFSFLANAFYGAYRIGKTVGIGLIVLFALRAVWFVIGCLGDPQAVMNLYSMVISEGLMGVLTWFLYRNLLRFLDEAGDCFVNLACTLSTGWIDDWPIPGTAERGFLVLGFLCPAWALGQIVTVTIVVHHIQSYYSLIWASHPAEYLAAAALMFNGVVCVLMRRYLRRYNRICEWEKYRARKQT